jgi:hypothetical protein
MSKCRTNPHDPTTQRSQWPHCLRYSRWGTCAAKGQMTPRRTSLTCQILSGTFLGFTWSDAAPRSYPNRYKHNVWFDGQKLRVRQSLSSGTCTCGCVGSSSMVRWLWSDAHLTSQFTSILKSLWMRFVPKNFRPLSNLVLSLTSVHHTTQ